MSFPQVELNTNKGRIVLELNSEKAPKTVANFLEYVRDGFYDGVIFQSLIQEQYVLYWCLIRLEENSLYNLLIMDKKAMGFWLREA